MHNTVWLMEDTAAALPWLDAAAATLGDDARAVLSTLTRDMVRRRFVLSRVLLRLAVSRYVECDPSTLVVTERRGDAPLVTRLDGDPPCISLSHSGAWIACAVSVDPIGVDIEDTTRTRDLQAISAWFYSDPEHAWMLRQTDPNLAFYRLWTGKEAVFKLAHQLGGVMPLQQIQFDVQHDRLCPPPPARSVRFAVPGHALACSIACAAAGRADASDFTHLHADALSMHLFTSSDK